MASVNRDEILSSLIVRSNLIVPVYSNIPPPPAIKGREGGLAYNESTGALMLNSADNTWVVAGPYVNLPSVASLRELKPNSNQQTVALEGYYSTGVGDGGLFYYDPLDTTSPDNGGTIFVAEGGYRWKRLNTDFPTVKWFGALGDGTTNDTASIQNAINVVTDANMGVLLFPSGTYMVSTLTRNAAADITLQGIGKESILQRIAGTPAGISNLLSFINSTGITVKGLNFRNISNGINGGTLYQDNCCLFNGCTNSCIKDCFFSLGLQGGAILVSCIGCTLSGNIIYEIGEDPANPTLANRANGSLSILDNSSSCKIIGNTVRTAANGIVVQCIQANSIITDCIVDSNTVSECAAYGIILYDNNLNNGGTGYMHRNVVSNNTVKNIYGSKLNNVDNLKDYGAGIYLQGAEYTSCCSNTITNTNIQTNGNLLTPAAIGVANLNCCTIVGNNITDPVQYGIMVANPSQFGPTDTGMVISGNTVLPSVTSQAAINVVSQSNLIIQSNIITGPSAGAIPNGIRLQMATVPNVLVSILGNIINSELSFTSAAIIVQDSTEVLVQDNNIQAGTTSQGTAISVTSGSSRVRVINNSIRRFQRGIRLTTTAGLTDVEGNYVNGSPACYLFDGVAAYAINNSGLPSVGTRLFQGIGAPFRDEPVNTGNLSARGAQYLRVDGTTSPVITALINGIPGQQVTIYNSAPGAGNVTLVYNVATLQLAGSVDLILTPRSTVTLLCTDNLAPVLWQEVSRKMA